MVDNLQAENEIWNRNIDILNFISLGQLQINNGVMWRNLRLIDQGCLLILQNITPNLTEYEDIETKDKEGNKVVKERAKKLRGINTKRFKTYWAAHVEANDNILMSENPNIEPSSRHQCAQYAWEILNALSIHLLCEVEDMGYNHKKKLPAHMAALTTK